MNVHPASETLKTKLRPKARPWYRSRGWWLKQFHNWHWITAALSMIGMLLFAATGITLNHAGSIGATPVTRDYKAQLSAPLIATLARAHAENAPLPAVVANEIDKRIGLDPAGKVGEWSDDEVYIAMPRPGGDAWVSIDRASGAVTAETTDRGWISWANDLHKGRNTGGAWSWFIDIFAGACVLFTLTGLILLYMHAKPRPLTWPIVGLGLVAPLLIILLFIH